MPYPNHTRVLDFVKDFLKFIFEGLGGYVGSLPPSEFRIALANNIPVRAKGLDSATKYFYTYKATQYFRHVKMPLHYFRLAIALFKYHCAFSRSSLRLPLWSARVMYLITLPR